MSATGPVKLTLPSGIPATVAVPQRHRMRGAPLDHVILSSPECTSSQHSSPWPSVFEVPCFAYDTELILKAANEAHTRMEHYSTICL